jgi:quercetin dioxygenase-like cupin family protein
MSEQMNTSTRARVLAAGEGTIVGGLGGVADRFMIDAGETGGRFAVVQHLFEPNALAAPLHRHHDEDEYTFVLTGRIGAISNGQEIVAGPGDLIVKPRGEWHTFWNAGDEPATVLEIISPGGLEALFKAFEHFTGPPDPQALAEMAATFHCDVDFERTMPIVERHGLAF